jgi:hypothetical protein
LISREAFLGLFKSDDGHAGGLQMTSGESFGMSLEYLPIAPTSL